jgi:hypothetical protein
MSVGNSKKTAKRERRMAKILARLEGHGVRPVETQWRWPHDSITVIRDWRINGAMFRPIGASSWDLPKARVDVFA